MSAVDTNSVTPSGRRVLLVSRSVPPALTGSAVVVDNLSRAFRPEEMVLAGKQPVEVGLGRRSPALPECLHLESAKAWQERWRGGRHLPLLMAPVLVRRLVRLIRQQGCTDVIGVFPDAAYLYASWRASRRCGCRFFPYFHNTFAESRPARPLAAWEGAWARWLQHQVFRDATHAFVMSEGMAAFYRERYPGLQKCSPLVHSFAEEMPQFRPPDMRAAPVFAFCGNVHASSLDAARRLAAAVGAMPSARLHYYTRASQTDLEQCGVWTPNAHLSRPDRKALLEGLASSDILLLPHGFTGACAPVEYQTMFPTKTIEYLIAGRPILAHSPPDVFLTRFLKEHRCALVVEEAEVRAVAEGIDRLRRDPDLRSALVRNALDTARLFRLSTVSARLREVIGLNPPA